MRHVRHAVLAFGVVVGFAVPARADDAGDARALVEKAVKAHGGREKLAKLTGHTLQFKGTFHGMGQAIPMTGEIKTQGADRQRIEVEVEAGGQKFRVLVVLNGDKGWTRMGDQTMEMDKDVLAEAREQAYAGWVATLEPLAGKQFTLATIGEVEIAKRPALGVKVTSKGRRDVDLYFDKATGLLVKTETRVKDEGSGQEVTEEMFPGEYKEVDGTKQSMKFTVKRDGKPYLDGEVTDYQLVEKMDASVFAKP